MGADMADYDNDGWPDIFVTALSLEGYVLFRNHRDGTFVDVSGDTGVRRSTFYLSGWGTHLADFENRGWKDLFVANGHVMRDIGASIRTLSYREPLLLLRNEGGRSKDVSKDAGPAFERPLAARGAAFGDLDNDGRLDAVVEVLGGEPVVLKNEIARENHWLGLELTGTKSNRDAIGSVIKVVDDAGGEQYYQVTRTGSYLSSSDSRVLIGFGDRRPVKIEIRWPSGRVQELNRPRYDQYFHVHEDQLNPQ